jgi:hypothetical protein
MLARAVLVAIDLVLSGEGLGLETALDLVHEIWRCYPELSALGRGRTAYAGRV